MGMRTTAVGRHDCEMAQIGKDGRCRGCRHVRTEWCGGTTYHEAVKWFKDLGYTVEPGPGLHEVTLINDRRPDFIAHYVVPIEGLAGMADLSQTITAQQIFRSDNEGCARLASR